MKYILMFLMVLMTVCSVEAKVKRMNPVIVTDELINALVKVESRGDSTKVGKYGELGILQIRQCVIDDVNNLIDHKKNWKIKDATNNTKAKQICRKYLEYWGNHYQKKTGRIASKEVLSKIWNGGPMYYKKSNKIFVANISDYWHKVQIALA